MDFKKQHIVKFCKFIVKIQENLQAAQEMVDFLHFFRENPLEIESLAKLVGQDLLRWADRFEHAEINNYKL